MLKSLTILLVAAVSAFASVAQKTAQVYGIRVYSEPTAPPALVSFPVDATSNLTEEFNLSDLIGVSVAESGNIRAAACDGSTYYMLVSEDGMMPYRLTALDLASKNTKVVRNYYGDHDPLGSIIVNDLAYNPADAMIYGVGYDLASAEIVGDEIYAQVALFVIDPATGDSEIRGFQDICAFSAITFNSYGDLMGIDTDGNIWSISSITGNPLDIVESTGITPAGTQSMATDPVSGDMYWAAYSADGYTPNCSLIKISMTEDWMFTITDLGQVANATELVGLYVDPDPISNAAPATPGSFEVEVAPGGDKKASLSWVNPSLTRGGAPLSDFSVIVYANDVKVTTLTDCTPGSADSFEYVAPESGLVTFSIAASSADGEGARAYAAQVFIGIDTPAAVGNLTALRNDPASYDITVSWDAPVSGASGGWINKEQLRYKVIRRIDGKVIADHISTTTVTDTDITATGAYIYDVYASTEAGEGPVASSAPCVSGPAINPPYTMNLANENDANLWTVANGDNDQYAWSLLKNWGGSDISFRFYPAEIVGGVQPTDDWLISPSFHLEAGKYYALSYDVRLWGALFPATYTVNIGQGAEPSALTRVLESNEQSINDMIWEKRSMTFVVDATGDYNLGFGVILANPMEIKGVYLREIPKTDLIAESIAGTVGASVGETATFTVTVCNGGFDTVTSYEVGLKDADGNTLTVSTFDEPIAALSTATVQIDWTPDTAGSYMVSAFVNASGDIAYDNNDTESLQVSVFPSGNWHEITDGKTYTAYVPFALRYKNSGAQTIYSSSEMGGTAASIMGMEYYYMPMGSSGAADFEARIALANTDVEDFDSSETLGADQFTTVYEGTMKLDPRSSKVTILFDTPFEYKGGNLCVLSQHSSESSSNMLFYAVSPKNGAKVSSVFYSDTDPCDFTQTVARYTDRPNVSFFMSDKSGVDVVGAESGNTTMEYDRAAKKLLLNHEAPVKVVSLQGVVLISTVGSVIDVSSVSGLAVVVAGDTTAKIIF